MGSAGPAASQILPAKVENGVQPLAHEHGMDQFPQPTPGHDVVHGIRHFDAARHSPEAMLVKPEAVRPEALLIDKPAVMLQVLDFRNPGQRNASHGDDPVGDDKARVQRVRHFRGNPEPQEAGRHGLQVARGGEEWPGFFQADGEELSALKAVDIHGQSSID